MASIIIIFIYQNQIQPLSIHIFSFLERLMENTMRDAGYSVDAGSKMYVQR